MPGSENLTGQEAEVWPLAGFIVYGDSQTFTFWQVIFYK